MDHWTGPGNPGPRTLFDAGNDITFKEDAFFPSYWIPPMEPEFSFDPCRFVPVGESFNEGFREDINGYQAIDGNVNSCSLPVESFGVPSGQFKRRFEFAQGEDHEEEIYKGSSSFDTWTNGGLIETKSNENYLRFSWDSLKKEPHEEFKMASFWQKNVPPDDTSAENSFAERRRSMETRKVGEKRQTKPEKVISLDVLRQHFARSLKDAAKIMGVCPTTLKRICRQHGITRWPSRKIKKVNHSLKKLQLVVDSVEGAEGMIKIGSLYSTFPELSSSDLPKLNNGVSQGEFDTLKCDFQKSDCSSSSHNSDYSDQLWVKDEKKAHDLPRGKARETLKVKATMGEAHIRFTLHPLWKFKDLQQEVARRFAIDDMSGVSLKYLDSDHEVILLTCDEDLEECKDLFKSSNIHIVKMTVHQS